MVWFRRDLRLRDNPALRAALEGHDRIVPAFCFDERLLGGRHASGPRTQFLLECLAELRDGIADRGGRLFVRSGRPERELAKLARDAGCEQVHFAYDVSPFARRRGERVAAALREAGIEPVAHPGLNAVDVREIRTQGDKPYTVFSPFHRNWAGIERRETLRAPRRIPVPSRPAAGRLPKLADLGLRQEVSEPAHGGESEARRRLDAFLRADVRRYDDNHDALGADRTSRLSPYLHFGCLSPRQVEERLPRGKGAEAFRRQLCWRDFYHHVLFHFPRNARSEFQDRYRGSCGGAASERAFDAWREGRTGFPLVDAGMRQLRREGWMHNRARLVVGLVPDQGPGHRLALGRAALHAPAAGRGRGQQQRQLAVDRLGRHRPAPPTSAASSTPPCQMERHDPDGSYVRKYVPELRSVPDERLREPWRMSEAEQRRARLRDRRDYPAPITDHAEARQEALARYREAASG